MTKVGKGLRASVVRERSFLTITFFLLNICVASVGCSG